MKHKEKRENHMKNKGTGIYPQFPAFICKYQDKESQYDGLRFCFFLDMRQNPDTINKKKKKI